MKHTEMIMVIEAHSEGKAIQCAAAHRPNDWYGVTLTTLAFNFGSFNYRVKPEPKYKVINSGGHGVLVEIKALEDALELSSGMSMTPDDIDIYQALHSLIN